MEASKDFGSNFFQIKQRNFLFESLCIMHGQGGCSRKYNIMIEDRKAFFLLFRHSLVGTLWGALREEFKWGFSSPRHSYCVLFLLFVHK
jgi:hypothetical protein